MLEKTLNVVTQWISVFAGKFPNIASRRKTVKRLPVQPSCDNESRAVYSVASRQIVGELSYINGCLIGLHCAMCTIFRELAAGLSFQ
jgi:hypothetical protein